MNSQFINCQKRLCQHYAYCNCNIGYKTNNPIWNTDLSSGCNEQIDSNNSSHLFEKYDGIFHLIAFWVLFAYQIFPDSNLDSFECNSFKGLFITQRLLRYVFDSLLNERLALWTFFLLVHIKFMNVQNELICHKGISISLQKR